MEKLITKPDKFDELSNDLCICLRFKHHALADEELLDVLVVSDDTIVHNLNKKFAKSWPLKLILPDKRTMGGLNN